MVTSDLRFAQSKSVLRTLAKNSFKAIDAGAYEINNTIELFILDKDSDFSIIFLILKL